MLYSRGASTITRQLFAQPPRITTRISSPILKYSPALIVKCSIFQPPCYNFSEHATLCIKCCIPREGRYRNRCPGNERKHRYSKFAPEADWPHRAVFRMKQGISQGNMVAAGRTQPSSGFYKSNPEAGAAPLPAKPIHSADKRNCRSSTHMEVK